MIYLELKAGTGKAVRRETGEVIQKLAPGFYAVDVEEDWQIPPRLKYAAARIWHETEDGVEYVKHLNMPISIFDKDFEVDMKEFTWVKLTAKVL